MSGREARLKMAIAALCDEYTTIEIAAMAVDCGVEESVSISRVLGTWDVRDTVDDFRAERMRCLAEELLAECGTCIAT